MSWASEDGRHEGWGAAVSPSGAVEVGSGGGVIHLDDGGSMLDDEVVGWRSVCSCGWRGPLWERVRDIADAEVAARRVWLDGGGIADIELEERTHGEWLAHVRPVDAVAAVSVAAGAVERARVRLDEAVGQARKAGASWEAVGQAVGISRQSAHERWGGR